MKNKLKWLLCSRVDAVFRSPSRLLLDALRGVFRRVRRTPLLPEQRSHGRSHVLHETLRGFVQRKDVSVMAKALPAHVKKEEIVLTVALTKEQKALTQRIFRDAK